jgi:Kdo2-lipid IVA lauroyltransferase/acyltransferase
MLDRLGIGFVWLMHLLPLGFIRAVGRAIGGLLYRLGRARVARINIDLCFPERTPEERERLVAEHFRTVGGCFLELGVAWWARRPRIERLVRIEGREHYEAVRDRRVIWLAPHFLGLDMGGTRIAMEYGGASLYSRQKRPVIDRMLYRSRTRFGGVEVFPRQEGLRPAVAAIKRGMPFYFLPDMDFGARDAVFVPFFGVSAATVTTLHRLCRITGAVVVPCVSRRLPGAGGYEVRFYPAWQDYPSADPVADTRRMNEFIEARVREMPEQYFWIHKRFRTRPPGEPSYYDRT